MISHVVSEIELVALTNVSRKVQPKILLESGYFFFSLPAALTQHLYKVFSEHSDISKKLFFQRFIIFFFFFLF